MSDHDERRTGARNRRTGLPDRRARALLDRRDWCDQLTGGWDRSLLPGNVRIGEGCDLESSGSFGPFASALDPGLVIGDRVTVYGWSSFTVGGHGFVEVGDDSVLVGAMFNCNSRISVGRRVVISYNVTLADSDMHPIDPEARRRDAVALSYHGDASAREQVELRPITIGDDVRIGAMAMILKGVTIGDGARVEAGSIVTGDVPPGAFVAGSPARVLDPSGSPR